MARGNIHIGTSGWSYDHWSGPFYPETLPTGQWLYYYARHFHSVEINSSFYRLPTVETLQNWRDAVPTGFVFSVKASRFITHIKKLKDARRTVTPLLQRISVLADRLGPVLLQLPPRWRFNEQRLADFLGSLSRDFRYAFEFRDPSWLNEQTCALLARHRAAFCIYELDGFMSPQEVTADFIYIRLHGPGAAYHGSYSSATLSGWADALSTWSTQGRSSYCYFDNDECGYAAHNALQLKPMLENRMLLNS